MDPKKATDKVDVEEYVQSYKVTNVEAFVSYLKEIWMDLTTRSNETERGINKLTFTLYYKLPGILVDCLFSVFDKNKKGLLAASEFIEGMKTLFTEPFEKCSKFIFDFYDFDKDGKITREDIRTVLSYLTLNQTSLEKEGYLARVSSQEEIYSLLNTCFQNVKGDSLNYKQFIDIVENVNSDIYFFILFFLYEKRPFSKKTISEYEKSKPLCKSPSPHKEKGKMVASPSVTSSLSPSHIVKRENKKKYSLQMRDNNAILLQYAGRDQEKKEKKTKANKLEKVDTQKPIETEVLPEKNAKVYRKTKTNLKQIEQQSCRRESKRTTLKIYNNLTLLPAYKLANPSETENKKGSDTDSMNESTSPSPKKKTIRPNEDHINNEIVEEDSNLIFVESDHSDSEEDVISHEGYLYKIIDNKKLKKLWFKLLYKDFYYYKQQGDTVHKGMHNLSGVFLKEEEPQILNSKKYFVFSIIYPKKSRSYLVDNESQFKIWVQKIKMATCYTNLTDIYDMTQKLGNGKFGLVKLGINKQTGRKVAIKIMSKKEMNNEDRELVNTEIEILKICQHPNIITLYDVFENIDFYYIIMEHCGGGDLFSYIEKKGFMLPEPRAFQIIHKICVAVFYIHSYGIAHRDLKPENVLMTSDDDNADIRILDFGLSKIIGPGEFCTEPYGTLSYVAPEVLLEKPYTKAVDMWSIGIMTYLLLSGSLPFDHPTDDREIAKQTVEDPVPYKSSIWAKISNEGKDFINCLLQKDPSKRMTIKEALEHAWIKKFDSRVISKRKTQEATASSFFHLYSSTGEKDK